MTAALATPTAETLAGRRRTIHHRAVRATERRVVGVMVTVGRWYWLIIVLAAIGVAVLQWRLGALDGSTVQYVAGSVRWFAFSLGVIVPMSMMRPHLAAGGTRRALLTGLERGAIWTGLGFGLVAAVLYALEQVVWNALGWDWHRSLGLETSSDVVSFVVNVAGEGLVTTTYFLLAVAVQGAFARFGPWIGLLICAGLALPAIAADIALYAGPATALAADLFGMTGPLPAAAGLVALAVLAVAVAGVGRLFLRDLPVRQAVA